MRKVQTWGKKTFGRDHLFKILKQVLSLNNQWFESANWVDEQVILTRREVFKELNRNLRKNGHEGSSMTLRLSLKFRVKMSRVLRFLSTINFWMDCWEIKT